MTTLQITVTITEYEGNDFPEAARFPAYVADDLLSRWPGSSVEVVSGSRQRISILAGAGASEIESEIEREIASVLPDLWEGFCAHGYKSVEAQP